MKIVLSQSPASFRKQSKAGKALRVLDQSKEPYRIDGDWVRLPREIMDALEYEGINDRYVKTNEYFTDFSLLGETETDLLIYEV